MQARVRAFTTVRVTLGIRPSGRVYYTILKSKSVTDYESGIIDDKRFGARNSGGECIVVFSCK